MVAKKIDIYQKYTSTSMLTGQNEEELTQWSIGYFVAHIAQHLPENKDANIFEIGCGYGRYVKAVQELGYTNARGLDISEEQIEYARNYLKLTNVVVGDAIKCLDGEIETYDAILLLDVLEHLDIEYSIKLLQLVKAALKPGGVLVLQVPNALAPLAPNRHWDITHLRAYTPHSMEQHLRLSGFSTMAHYELPPHIHGAASFARLILWLLLIKPLIACYMLIANSCLMGGIYTTNMLTVVINDESL